MHGTDMRSIFVKPTQNTVIKVEEDTQYILDIDEFKKDSKYSVELQFIKQGVSAEIMGMFYLPEKNYLDLTTIARHLEPNTSCMTDIKSVLSGGSFSNYIGKILIDKKAQQTNSYLQDSVLITGENTHNNSQPILEIEADDVSASHGATTGRIDKDQVYYLMSRGLDRFESEDLIVKGFFESLVSRIDEEGIRDKVREKIGAKLL